MSTQADPSRALSHRERQRLADIQAAINAIRSHLRRGDLSDGLVFDAVRIRLVEIGEAVKALPARSTATLPPLRLDLPASGAHPHGRPSPESWPRQPTSQIKIAAGM